jgi:hypothetical protein
MRTVGLAMIMGLAVGACAGRAPQPVAVVQPQDRFADCTAISAEIEANNQKVPELASEQGLKVGQNVAAGVAGLVVWPLLFAMDFQDTAGKEVAALQSRQQYLATLAEQRCVVRRRRNARRLASIEPGRPAPHQRLCDRLEGARLLGDRRVPQSVGRKAVALALRSVEPSARHHLFSIGSHADIGHRHPWTSGFQLDCVSDLESHYRPRNSDLLDWRWKR